MEREQIINPQTGRLIFTDGETYKQLLKHNHPAKYQIVPKKIKSPKTNQLIEVPGKEYQSLLKEYKKESLLHTNYWSNLPIEVQAIIGKEIGKSSLINKSMYQANKPHMCEKVLYENDKEIFQSIPILFNQFYVSFQKKYIENFKHPYNVDYLLKKYDKPFVIYQLAVYNGVKYDSPAKGNFLIIASIINHNHLTKHFRILERHDYNHTLYYNLLNLNRDIKRMSDHIDVIDSYFHKIYNTQVDLQSFYYLMTTFHCKENYAKQKVLNLLKENCDVDQNTKFIQVLYVHLWVITNAAVFGYKITGIEYHYVLSEQTDYDYNKREYVFEFDDYETKMMADKIRFIEEIKIMYDYLFYHLQLL